MPSVSSRRILLLGIGNVLMGDDGLGPTLIALLRAGYRLPEELEVIDAGTPGLDLGALIAGVDHLLVTDAVRSADPPGTVVVLNPDRLAPPSRAAGTPHDPGLLEALAALEFAGGRPDSVSLIGIVPERVELDLALSETVAAALPAALAALVAELVRLGCEPEPVADPPPPDLWWRRP